MWHLPAEPGALLLSCLERWCVLCRDAPVMEPWTGGMLRFMEMFPHASKCLVWGEMSWGAARPRDLSLPSEQESTTAVPAAPGTELASHPPQRWQRW